MTGDLHLGTSGNMKLLTGTGRLMTVEPIEILNEKRTVNGTLRSDLIAIKKLFIINYELLKGADIETVLDVYEEQVSGGDIIFWEYDRQNVKNIYNVKMRSIPRDRMTVLGDWIWAGVSIELEEI